MVHPYLGAFKACHEQTPVHGGDPIMKIGSSCFVFSRTRCRCSDRMKSQCSPSAFLVARPTAKPGTIFMECIILAAALTRRRLYTSDTMRWQPFFVLDTIKRNIATERANYVHCALDVLHQILQVMLAIGVMKQSNVWACFKNESLLFSFMQLSHGIKAELRPSHGALEVVAWIYLRPRRV